MEELGPIIMFVLYVLYIIFGGSKKKKKQQPIFDEEQTQKPQPSKRNPKNLEDYLKDILEQTKNQPTQKTEKPFVEQKQTASEAMDFKGKKRTYQHKKSNKKVLFDDAAKQNKKTANAIEQKKRTLQQKIEELNKSTIDSLNENKNLANSEITEAPNFIDEKLKNFQFDAVDAVIYTEIFKRKEI